MGKLAEAYVDITSQDKKLDDGMAIAHKKLEGFVSKANSLLGAVAIGVGGAGIVAFLKDAAEKGSNLGETMSKVKEVFGSATGTVTAMADDMAKKFGAVRQTTLDAAANLGLVAQGAGMGAKASADLAVKLTRLADDASSFYNVPLDVALEKIRSGLVGEAEPLRAFGVLLSEANMKATALAMGMRPVKGEFTESEKVMARVEIITRGLAKAQGDHARTLGSYANQIRLLKGEWENFQTSVGGPIAGGAALIMQNARQQGAGPILQQILGGGMAAAAVPGGVWQAAADKAAGLAVGLPKPGAFKAEVIERQGDIFAKIAKQGQLFGGVGNTPFGMFGMLGPELMAGAQKGELDFAIRMQKRQLESWSGGHVMGTEAFMKQAQEKILAPKDEVGEKQLAELKAMRELLNDISKAKPITPLGVRLTGRE